jgi:hypothetical protein
MRKNLSSGVYLGYNGISGAYRKHPEDKYQVWFDQPSTPWGNLRDESIKAARQIRAQTDQEICVLYSGGLDSEWVLESFRLANIPVTAVVIEYADSLNSHDMHWARRYLSRHSTPHIIHPFDLKSWCSSDEMKQLARTVQTPELAYTAQMQTILNLRTPGRCFVTGYDEPLIVANDTGEGRDWNLVYAEKHYSVPKFFHAFDIDGCSNWSRQNASLFASYVTQAQWRMLAANLYAPSWWNSELVKVQMYRYWFQNLEPRPKYTGFEQSLSFLIQADNEWREEYPSDQPAGYTWNTESSQDIHEVWRLLGLPC